MKIAWMYPDSLSLHGEAGSVQALLAMSERLSLPCELIRVDRFSDAFPADADLVLYLPGTLRTIHKLLPVLREQAACIHSYVENGGHIISFGMTNLLFSKSWTELDGTVYEGLGLLDQEAVEYEYLYSDDLHWEVPGVSHPVLGIQNQRFYFNVADNAKFGKVIFGYGNMRDGSEGARYRNLLCTNCFGPMFVKNPWWARQLLCEIEGIPEPDMDFDLEEKSYQATLCFIETKKKPDKEGLEGEKSHW